MRQDEALSASCSLRYGKEGNLIEIYEIPYTTTVEAIMDKTAELIKAAESARLQICVMKPISVA